MIKARGVIFIAAALGLAFLIARMVSSYFEAAEPETAWIVVAAADIPPGDALTMENLTRTAWPAGRVPRGAFGDVEVLVGRVAADGIYKGEPVYETRLVSPVGGPATVLSGRIDPGMRAVSIEIDDVSGVSGMLRAGDRVDVIVSGTLKGEDETRISRVILSRVALLSVSYGEGSGRRSSRSKKGTATLLLSPEEAGILAASEGAELILARRDPADETGESLEATIFSAALGPKTTTELEQLGRARDERLQAAIRPGMRAVTVQVNDEDGICGHLQPGNRVDVLGTHPFVSVAFQERRVPGAEGIVTGSFQSSRILMQDVEVLFIEEDTELTVSAGRSAGGAGGSADSGAGEANTDDSAGQWVTVRPVKRVTLLVSPEDAERLAVIATADDGVKLIVRKYGDEAIVETEGEISSEIFYSGEERYYDIDVFGQGPLRGNRLFERDELDEEAPAVSFGRGAPDPGI